MTSGVGKSALWICSLVIYDSLQSLLRYTSFKFIMHVYL